MGKKTRLTDSICSLWRSSSDMIGRDGMKGKKWVVGFFQADGWGVSRGSRAKPEKAESLIPADEI